MYYTPRLQKFTPLTPQQWSIAMWNRLAPPYATDWVPMYKPLYDRIVDQALLEFRSEKYPEVLDVAATAGQPGLSILSRFPTATLVSTDNAAYNIQIGKSFALKIGKGADEDAVFQWADVEELQFDDSSFDLVVCSLGIMYVCDYETAISELARVTRPGRPPFHKPCLSASPGCSVEFVQGSFGVIKETH